MIRKLKRKWKTAAVCAVIIAFIVVLAQYIVNENFAETKQTNSNSHILQTGNIQEVEPSLSVILQDIDPFANSAKETASFVAKTFPQVTVLIVSDVLPYPPVKVPDMPNVKLITLKTEVGQTLNSSRPELNIKSNFVIFLPDGTSFDNNLISWLKKIVSERDLSKREGFAIPLEKTHVKCHGLDFNVKTWTLEITSSAGSSKCNLVTGDHAILLQTKHLYLMSDPYLPLTFLSVYIQLSLVKFNFVILDDLFLLPTVKMSNDPERLWQQKHFKEKQKLLLYSELGVKQVIKENGEVLMYGCSKHTQRCFDTVYDDMPEYLYQGRWTPPCCLRNLRKTAEHVFGILDGCKVRWWLEGGSLLGAARNQDIIPWDYDIDIGIYREDMVKCKQLSQVLEEAFVDEYSFSWEKAIEGDFYRVQFSEENHLHVDIFPFYPKNGFMTKNTWMKNHKQDMEFSELFLKPLTRIQFAGLNASAPNHVRKFLEMKFGKGVIETPKFPNAKVVE